MLAASTISVSARLLLLVCSTSRPLPALTSAMRAPPHLSGLMLAREAAHPQPALQ